jgi:hypothetical protein
MRARVSNRARRLVHMVFRDPQDSDGPNLKVAACGLQQRNLEI